MILKERENIEINHIEFNILSAIYSNQNSSINKKIEYIYKKITGEGWPVIYFSKNNLLVKKSYREEITIFTEVCKKIAHNLHMNYKECSNNKSPDGKIIDKNSIVLIKIDLLSYNFSQESDNIFNFILESLEKSGGTALILENIQYSSKLTQSKVLNLVNNFKNIYIGLTSSEDIKNINPALISRMEIL